MIPCCASMKFICDVCVRCVWCIWREKRCTQSKRVFNKSDGLERVRCSRWIWCDYTEGSSWGSMLKKTQVFLGNAHKIQWNHCALMMLCKRTTHLFRDGVNPNLSSQSGSSRWCWRCLTSGLDGLAMMHDVTIAEYADIKRTLASPGSCCRRIATTRDIVGAASAYELRPDITCV